MVILQQAVTRNNDKLQILKYSDTYTNIQFELS